MTLDIVQYQKKQQTGGEEAATKLASKDKYVKEPHEVGEDKFTALKSKRKQHLNLLDNTCYFSQGSLPYFLSC